MPRGAGRIGWWLVWAVVFCDIGTSVYYVPGILSRDTGDHAGFFVVATMVAFVLLCVKQVEITRRFASGGGVVSVADDAFGPWWGCLGGQLILVDFFLTVAISAASGVYYISSILDLGPFVVPATVVAVILLAALNIIGIKESAIVSFVLAIAAFVVDLLVIGTTLVRAPASMWGRFIDEFASLGELGVNHALAGYAGAWLAFSGLESLAQVAPAMKDLGETPRRGMIAVVASVLLTAPMLTFLSSFSLSAEAKAAGSDHFISELAGMWGGYGLKLAVVLTASTLLLFAANTAIIGSYHVQVALTRRGFLPDALADLSRRYQTPYRAILLCTALPIVVVLASGADMAVLGGLYAFGLLGAFVLGSVGVDVIRWREGQRGTGFWLGVLTSLAVLLAFGVNLVAKPSATVFGGSLAAVGMLTALATRRGWFDRVIALIPGLAPPPAVESTGLTYRTVASARALVDLSGPAGVMVASRGATLKIFREAADRARARGLSRIFLIYVDEVPGLFYPQLTAPTGEGLKVLDAGMTMIHEVGMEAVPVWALSHSAAQSVAEAVETLHCDTVVIGATQRTFLWQALRGRFIQDLLAALPSHIRLIVVG